jgi:hypothetical protein
MIELCPDTFLRNYPLGHFHTFMLSLAAEAKVYSDGCYTSALIDFLWFVRVFMHFPVPISHSFMKVSWLPVITCGSLYWVTTEPTVWEWPTNAWTCFLTLTSHTLAAESLPPETKTFRPSWILRQ